MCSKIYTSIHILILIITELMHDHFNFNNHK